MIRRIILILELILISFVATAQLPVAYDVTGGGAYCQGGSGVSISLSGSEVDVTYELWNGVSATGTIIIGTGLALNFTGVTTAGTYTVVGTNGNGTTSMSGSAVITVNPLPAEITGTSNVCAGSTVTLSSATIGGTWSSGTPAVATVFAESGVVTGVLAGSSVITYTLGTGCFVTQTVTVNPLPTTSAIYHH